MALTADLAEQASELTFDAIPDDVVEVARHAMLDWFGVALAGSAEAPARILARTLPASADGVTAVGMTERFAPLDATLLNGTASHALDFDDMSLAFVGHATVAVLPAALALAEERDASAGDLVTAFVAGYETACRVAVALGPEPYRRGFHQTGTVGTFGAAAAGARLLGLDGQTTAVALGLAATQAAGMKCSFGTMAKPLHAGKACQSGLLAALLASEGFTGNPGAIEADQGFAALTGGARDAAPPPDGWHLRDNLFKYHASCFWTHSALEGIGSLGVRPAAVERVEIHVDEVQRGTCAIAEPASALEVKFSIAHLAAMALLKRPTSAIADADARDAEVVALRDRIELVDDGVAGEPTRVDIVLRDGSVASAAHDVNAAARDLDAQAARLSAKFTVLAAPVIGDERTARLRDAVLALGPGVPARALMGMAR